MNKKQFTSVLIVLILLVWFTSCTKKDVYTDADHMVLCAEKVTAAITPDELKTKIDSMEYFTLIDVREPNEYNAGYIPGSVNIPRGILEFNIGKEKFWDDQFMYMPEKTEEIIVYCKKGKRSILAAESLQKLGYENIKYLDSGWKGWELKYPLIYEKNLDAHTDDHPVDDGGC